MLIPILYGPTGVGKSELVMALKEVLPIEIISMDSMQIYRGMDIGTAKAKEKERQAVKHWMIDIVSPDEEYNAYRYREEATILVDGIVERGNIPIFVGGTGLYLDTLKYGLFDGISKDEKLRRDLYKREESDPGCLRHLLKDKDAESFERIHPNDIKRTIRALEVYFLSGKTISEAQKLRRGDSKYQIIEISRERQDLYERIDLRVEKMVREGLLQETEHLLQQGYTSCLTSMKAIGYRETISFLTGAIPTKEQYIHQMKINTHHYARRQIIWGRRYSEKFSVNLSGTHAEQRKQETIKTVEIIQKML